TNVLPTPGTFTATNDGTVTADFLIRGADTTGWILSGAAGAETKVLAGSISMVFALPGVGLNPYLLGGLGQYRVEAGPAERTDRGFHGGFGVVLGALGLGAFAEIRYVRISSDTGPTTKMIPLTVGVRF
ncbi:MAG: hypothetical protein IIC35_07155, partial [Gemmatimonadetes bacterium]|nr:hypothetical protein [Gemmatimonadota bacterium]